MRSLYLIVALLNVWSVWGQTFNKRYDLRDIGRPNGSWGIERTLDNDYIVIVVSSEMDTLEPGLYFSHYAVGLTKINGATGEKLWDKRFFPPMHGYTAGWANCCDSMPGGGVVVAGSIEDLDDNLMVHLAAFDANGDTVFTRNLGHPGPRWNAFQVKRLQDGGFIIVGQTQATGYLDGFAIRTDDVGNEVWRKTYGQPSPQTDALVFVVELPDGNLLFGGSKYPTNTTRTHWLIKADPSGEIITDALWPETVLAGGPSISLLSNGDILVASNVPYAPNYLQDRFYLAAVDPLDLSIIWEKEYASPAFFQVLYTAKETPTGDIIACGVSEEAGGMQGVLLRTTSEGDSLWMFRYFYQDDVISTGTGQFYDVLPTPDGGFIATGPTYNPLNEQYPPGYSQDAWVVKVDGQGCIVPGCNSVGIEEQATNLLDALRIWPNPVHSRGQVHVELDLPPSVQTKDLELSIVSMDGKVVYRQAVSPLLGRGAAVLRGGGNGNAAGVSLSHSFTFSLYHPSSGLYHLHITNGTTWLTGGKLVVE